MIIINNKILKKYNEIKIFMNFKGIKLNKVIFNNLSLIIFKNELIVFKFSNVNEI